MYLLPANFYLNSDLTILQDNKDARHVKTYEVQLKEKDFGEGPWLQNNLDNGAGLLIPVPLPLGGAIIIGEQTIVYYNGSVFKAIPIRPVPLCLFSFAKRMKEFHCIQLSYLKFANSSLRLEWTGRL